MIKYMLCVQLVLIIGIILLSIYKRVKLDNFMFLIPIVGVWFSIKHMLILSDIHKINKQEEFMNECFVKLCEKIVEPYCRYGYFNKIYDNENLIDKIKLINNGNYTFTNHHSIFKYFYGNIELYHDFKHIDKVESTFYNMIETLYTLYKTDSKIFEDSKIEIVDLLKEYKNTLEKIIQSKKHNKENSNISNENYEKYISPKINSITETLKEIQQHYNDNVINKEIN